MSLSCAEITFFEAHSDALSIYKDFARAVGVWDGVSVHVQKTQIAFSNRHVFACVSFLRVRRKAAMPPVFLTLSLGMPVPPEKLTRSCSAGRAKPALLPICRDADIKLAQNCLQNGHCML